MSALIPIIRYRDPRAGMEFLCRAFGFEKHAVHEGPDGELQHVELRHDNGIVMISDERASDPAFSGEAGHGFVYVVVVDPDAVHDRAKAAGAEITMELRDTDYGSRDWTGRDPEGNVWSFGRYRPSVEGSAG